MQLNVNRFLSDRIIFDPLEPEKLKVTNSFWDWVIRVIAWIWSPASYTDENRRTINCFKKYLVDTLGPERLQRICSRYQMNLDALENKGSPLLSRDVAKILVGANSITVSDINEFLQKSDEPRWKGKKSFLELERKELAEICQKLLPPFNELWKIPPIVGEISGRPTDTFACVFFDPFLADRERLELVKEHAKDRFDVFMHNMVARVIKRDMEVGTLVPAPNSPEGEPQFYYVSARLVTGKGMVSYLFHPAGQKTNLEPIRLFRGTATRNSELDALSTMITDLEKDLGRTAYQSGLIYEPVIQDKLPVPTIEGGHSLGSTVVQYRLANMDHIRKAYLYCGPGLPMSEVEKFNQKPRKPKLIIRATEGDIWHKLGDAHLGHRIGSHEHHVDIIKYRPPKKKGPFNPHVTVWEKEKYEHEASSCFPPEVIDQDLHSKHLTTERLRASIGPVFAGMLSATRFLARKFVKGRIYFERGLKIGAMENNQWKVHHYRAV